MLGDLNKKTPLSLYQPPQDVCDLTSVVKEDFLAGDEILNRVWTELNDYSIIERMNKDQRTFNAYVDINVEDENDAWKWKGTRSMARNKAIAMHAHLTSNYIIPEVSAQNENDEEDIDMADVMHDIVEWMTSPGNSNYQPAFLMATMGMLVNPVTYLSADYAEIYQEVKEKLANGKYTKKEIIDEVMSGFQAKVYSADQILITNAYEQNIQRQRALNKRKAIDYIEAEAQYGEHPNWSYVQRGIKSIFNEEDGLFYDVKDDDDVQNLVEETTYMNRRNDTEVCFINGIYMGETDVFNGNPMKHRDNRDAPKYNVVPFGYNRINEHFFYYKSMMNALGWDNDLIDAMYETTMNRELLNLLMPVAITGEESVDTDIIFPGSVTAFANKDTQVKPLLPGNNSSSGYNAMAVVERSITEGSKISDTAEGQTPPAGTTAYAIAQAAEAAKVLLSAVGKTLAESVTQFGSLMIDIAVTHLTVADVEELSGGQTKLKYKSFILNDKTIAGKKANKRIKFDPSLMGYEMDKTQKEDMGLSLAEEVGYPNNKEHLYLVNPPLFARMKYLVRTDPNRMFIKNQEYQQGVMKELYAMLRQDPLIEPEALVRKLTYAYFRSEGEELMAKGGGIVSQIMGNNQQQTPNQSGAGTATSPIRKSLSTAVSSAVGT